MANRARQKRSVSSGPPAETEIIIRPDGRVIIADLALGLLPVALELNPEDPRLQALAALHPRPTDSER